MPEDRKVRGEIEIAIRDMFSAQMKEMGRQLDGMNKKAVELGQGASASFEKFRRENDQLAESTKRTTASLTGMRGIVKTMTEGIVGPAGLVYGLYSAAKSLEEFSTGRVQLQMLSTDVGFTTGKIKLMQATLADMGISAADSKALITKLGGELQQLATLKLGSPLFDQLSQMGEGKFAANLLKVVESGDFNKAMDMIVAKYESMSTAARSHLSVNVLGIPESVLQNYRNFEKQVGEVFIGSYEHSQNYLRNMNKFERELSDIWEKAKDAMITGLDDAGAFEKLNHKLEEEVRDIKAIYSLIEKQPFGKSFDFLNKTPLEAITPQGGFTPKPEEFGKRPIERLREKRSELQGTHSDITDFSGRRRTDDLVEVETDSNRLLREVRDSLQRMEFGDAGGGGGGAQTYGHGIRTGGGISGIGGGAAHAGLGGFRPVRPGGMGATRSGGGSGGITAAAGTPIQGGMAEVSTPDGKKFKVDPSFKENFQGFIDDYYKAGGKFGPDTGTLGERPSNASGHPIGDAIDVNQIGRGIRSNKGTSLAPDVEDSLAAKWGFVSGNQWRGNDQGHFGIRSAKAAREALINQGITPSEADHATGLTSGVKGSWFDDKNTASGRSAATTAGIALPSREGLGKMYEVTGPDGRKMLLPQIDVGPAKWTGRGIDISKPAMQGMGYDPTDKNFSYHQIQSDRERIDKTQSVASRVDANMNASVDFKNMPSWVKSSVDSNGVFKNLKVTRSTPQAGKAGSGIESSNPWAYE